MAAVVQPTSQKALAEQMSQSIHKTQMNECSIHSVFIKRNHLPSHCDAASLPWTPQSSSGQIRLFAFSYPFQTASQTKINMHAQQNNDAILLWELT